MKLAFALTALLFGFSVYGARPPKTAEILLTCTEKAFQGTASIQLDLVRAGGRIYLQSSLNMLPGLVSMKRTSINSFVGTEGDHRVTLDRTQDQEFVLSIEKAFDPVFSWGLQLKMECTAPRGKIVSFCESYEDFEECKNRGTAGPDGPIDDGEGGGPSPQNPDDPGDGGF